MSIPNIYEYKILSINQALVGKEQTDAAKELCKQGYRWIRTDGRFCVFEKAVEYLPLAQFTERSHKNDFARVLEHLKEPAPQAALNRIRQGMHISEDDWKSIVSTAEKLRNNREQSDEIRGAL